jgi:predicted phosphate transport protein (TIGR00153 family)
MLIFKKEKAVIELIFRHIDKTAECVRATIDSLRAYIADNDSDSRAAVRLVNSIESEADALLRDIRDMLYSGAYLPQIRGDIYRLMSAIDDVSNKAENCFDHFHYQFPEIPDEYVADIDAILDLTLECFSALQKGLKAFFGPKDKLEKVRKHGMRVSEFESRIDELERELTARIFKTTMDKGEKLHLQRCLRTIAAISDATEDAADQLQWVSVKSII